jgi:hypothetical protein
MKRAWAIPVLLFALLGCRNSQPATNPFLRTTVAPPGTGDGAVILPAEPYAPGAAPPGAVAAPPPGAVPVSPAPAAVVPVVPPRDPKYSPPGGSYMFHQSSLESRQDIDPDDPDDVGEEAAANLADAEATGELRLGGPSDAIEQALALSRSPAPETLANYEEYDGELPNEIAAADARDDEPAARPRLTAKTVSTGKRVFTARSRDASAPPRIGISPTSSAQVMAAGADDVDEANLELDMPRPDGASIQRSAANRPQRSLMATFARTDRADFIEGADGPAHS